METTTAAPDLLAALLTYPGEDYRGVLDLCRREAAGETPEAANLLDDFALRIAELTPEQLEELYVQTFELNPACSLEVGWRLFGERYERGEFLVYLRGLLREHGVAETTELPDHLTYLPPLLARMAPDDSRTLYTDFVSPALDKMLGAFEGTDNPFELLIRTVRVVMDHYCVARHEEALS